MTKATGKYEVYAKPSISESYDNSTFDGIVWMQLDHVDEAESWAEDFVENVGCLNTYNSKPAKWDEYALDWSASLTNGAKSCFTEAIASNDEEASFIQQAAFIHDMCVAKYDGCDIFMAYNDGEYHTRGLVLSSNKLINVESNNAILVITFVSIALVSCGFLAIRRRKEN